MCRRGSVFGRHLAKGASKFNVMTGFTAAELEALEAGAPRRAVFMRLATSPIIRLWLGIGKIKPGVNSLDTVPGAIYLGHRDPLDIPELNAFTDGSAERVTFALDGIAPTTFSAVAPLMAAQQATIKGRAIAIGYALMGYDWQLLGAVRWTAFGFADFLRAVHGGADDAESAETWRIELSAGFGLTGRKRGIRSYFTDSDQVPRAAELNPLANRDRFCERTPIYADDVDKVWPDF